MKNFFSRRTLFIVSVILAALLTACGGGGGHGLPSGGGGGAITSITVTPTPTTMYADRTLQLVATDNFGNNITTTVAWGTDLGTISAQGLFTPFAAGTANITATSGLIVGNATITVNAPALAFSVGGVTDPLAVQQWHLNNTGQTGYADTAGTATEDINVNSVYSTYGIDGTGVIVAVVDTGLEIAHEDLTANVVVNGSWDFVGSDTDPTNAATDGDHGTSVAGLIASTRNNAVGGLGVASRASLKGFNFLESAQSTAQFLQSLGGSTSNPNSSDVWIFNQSYGYSTAVPLDPALFSAVTSQMSYGASTLRGGKGALYVKAAGNGFEDDGAVGGVGNCAPANAIPISCENASFDPLNTEPYNIVVGALNADGEKSSYSTTGSALWVSAPGGEFGANVAAIGAGALAKYYEPAMVTTDQSSCTAGYAQISDITYVYSTFSGNTGGVGTTPAAPNANCNYTNGMNGTSSATPVTAGVIALMLEANPALTWRDVKHILATTSTQVQPGMAPITVALSDGNYTVEPAWFTNAAGRAYHNWFGFGRVNAAAAVAAARNYIYGSLGTFTNTGFINSGAISLAVPDNSTVGVTSTITVPTNLVIEAVQIRVSGTHTYNGDLGFELLSPSGTRSVLKYVRDGFTGGNYLNFQLLSNAFYGEPSNGVWTLKVVDGNAVDTGNLTSWSIRIYGH